MKSSARTRSSRYAPPGRAGPRPLRSDAAHRDAAPSLRPASRSGASRGPDRGCSDRPLVELREELGDREAEVFLDHLLDVGEREAAHVLKPRGSAIRAEKIRITVERSCPNLTKVGPSSSSISRRCWPRCERLIVLLQREMARTGYRPRGVSNQSSKPWRTATCASRRPRLRVAARPSLRVTDYSRGADGDGSLPCPRPGSVQGATPGDTPDERQIHDRSTQR